MWRSKKSFHYQCQQVETTGALAMKKVEKDGDMRDDVTYR